MHKGCVKNIQRMHKECPKYIDTNTLLNTSRVSALNKMQVSTSVKT